MVRWSKLPSLYSHYGSRGIIIMAILQSWSQGVEVWGERGMKKLWSAANVKVYGGGVAVDDGVFLRDMSTAIGDHWEITGRSQPPHKADPLPSSAPKFVRSPNPNSKHCRVAERSYVPPVTGLSSYGRRRGWPARTPTRSERQSKPTIRQPRRRWRKQKKACPNGSSQTTRELRVRRCRCERAVRATTRGRFRSG